MGLLWNLASAFFVLAIAPSEALQTLKQPFVLAMSLFVVLALYDETRRTVRPD